MNIITIGQLNIGEGLPKICVPLVAENEDDLARQAGQAAVSGCDLVEWRIDGWPVESNHERNKQKILEEINRGLSIIRDAAREGGSAIPVLLTLRTAREGGRADLSRNDYCATIIDIIGNCNPELIDIEAFDYRSEPGNESDGTELLVGLAHSKDMAVVLSNHDFETTPPAEEIVKRICIMDSIGGDIPKVAYMPQTEEDVHTVIQAAHTAAEYTDKPFVAISMGELGTASRFCSGQSGSAITFATAGTSSAPGQVSVEEMGKHIAAFYGVSAADEQHSESKTQPEPIASDNAIGAGLADTDSQKRNLIEIENLTFRYPPDEQGREKTALDGISLSIEEGSFTCILGSNGSGKSTLAKHLNALLIPSEGTVRIAGMDTRDDELTWDIRQNVGMVFQNPDNQIVSSIVEDDVAFGPENMGVDPAEIRKRVDEALGSVNMGAYKKKGPHMLSGGQKQRIAIAGAIAMRPRCIVFDEPTAMLDPKGRQEVVRIIKKLNGEGITAVLITHFMEEAAAADRIIILNKGKVAMDGSPSEVFSRTEELEALNLDVPLAVRMKEELSKQGINIDENVVGKKELVEAICRLK